MSDVICGFDATADRISSQFIIPFPIYFIERPSNPQLQLQSPNMLLVEVDKVCFENENFKYDIRQCRCVQINGIQNLTDCIEYHQSSREFYLDMNDNSTTYNVSCTVTMEGNITLSTATILVSTFNNGKITL